MKTDVIYEIIDLRVGVLPFPERMGIIRQFPGGLTVITPTKDFFLEWDDDDDEAFTDDEKNGMLSIVTAQGRIEFHKLGLDNWAELEPFWQAVVPDFGSDGEVNDYFYRLLVTT